MEPTGTRGWGSSGTAASLPPPLQFLVSGFEATQLQQAGPCLVLQWDPAGLVPRGVLAPAECYPGTTGPPSTTCSTTSELRAREKHSLQHHHGHSAPPEEGRSCVLLRITHRNRPAEAESQAPPCHLPSHVSEEKSGTGTWKEQSRTQVTAAEEWECRDRAQEEGERVPGCQGEEATYAENPPGTATVQLSWHSDGA